MKTGFYSDKSLFYSLIFLLFSLLALKICSAESVDQIVNPKASSNTWVSDMADVIDPDSENQLNMIIDDLERKTTSEIAVVTVKNVDNSTPKDFATELFNLWKIGKVGKDNGVLVLLVMSERRVEVETGYGVEGVLPDGKVGEILREKMVPHFKEGNFGKGILAGVQEMTAIIANEKSDIAIGSEADSVSQNPAPTAFIWSFIIFILLIIASPFLLIYLIWRHLYYRKCSQCKKRMRKLTEDQEDVYLSFDEKFEEELGSMNYTVWRCDDCQINKIEKSKKGYGKYEECPKCKHRTVYIKSARIKNPTTISTGLEEITRKCQYPKCNYHNVSKRTIPPIVITNTTRSRSSGRSFWSSSGGSWGGSSGGSFGGGSSGGGGAGASW